MITQPLTYEQYYTQLTNLLDGVQIDDTLFGIWLNMVRNIIESERPWVVLRKIDKSNTSLPTDTWQTPKNLPADFFSSIDSANLSLFDGTNKIQTYSEVPFASQLDYKDSQGVFWIDYANNQYYSGGVSDQQYAIRFPYIADFGDIVAGGTWKQFPARFNMVLVYAVSILQKGGVDYDDQNARMVLYNDTTFKQMMSMMTKWDSRLQLAMSQNRDFYQPGSATYRTGAINITAKP